MKFYTNKQNKIKLLLYKNQKSIMNENLINYYTVNAKNDVYKIYKNKKT